MKTYTQAELLDDLRIRCHKRSQLAVAIELELSASFVNDVLKGRREMTINLARAMGYQPMQQLYTRSKQASEAK